MEPPTNKPHHAIWRCVKDFYYRCVSRLHQATSPEVVDIDRLPVQEPRLQPEYLPLESAQVVAKLEGIVPKEHLRRSNQKLPLLKDRDVALREGIVSVDYEFLGTYVPRQSHYSRNTLFDITPLMTNYNDPFYNSGGLILNQPIFDAIMNVAPQDDFKASIALTDLRSVFIDAQFALKRQAKELTVKVYHAGLKQLEMNAILASSDGECALVLAQ